MARDRFDHRVDRSDDTKATRLRRVEVITGVERRRSWRPEEKLRIVAESMADGAVVSEVARRHGISPQQLFGWRARIRVDAAAMSAGEVPRFAPAIVDNTASPPANTAPLQPDDVPLIEISVGLAVVRVRGAVDAKALTLVLRALKALA